MACFFHTAFINGVFFLSLFIRFQKSPFLSLPWYEFLFEFYWLCDVDWRGSLCDFHASVCLPVLTVVSTERSGISLYFLLYT